MSLDQLYKEEEIRPGLARRSCLFKGCRRKTTRLSNLFCADHFVTTVMPDVLAMVAYEGSWVPKHATSEEHARAYTKRFRHEWNEWHKRSMQTQPIAGLATE